MFVSDRACPVRRLLAPNKRTGECSVNFPEKFSVEKKALVLIRMMRQVAVRTATDGNLATGKGGFLSFLGGGSYRIHILMYHDVSCMYPACILKDTCILSVS